MGDERGNKNSSDFGSKFEIGPPGHTRTYHQPRGWSRYGFKVLGKYKEDTWLHPFQHPRNWYRAYHGTGRSRVGITAPKSIVHGGFEESGGGDFGPGVYVTPFVTYAEQP